jgi:hypothetical protein
VFLYGDNNVYDLNLSVIVSSVDDFEPANEYFMYSTTDSENGWHLKTFNGSIGLGNIDDPYKIYRKNDQIYLSKSDGIYTPEYLKSIVFDIDRTDTQGEDYSDISLGGNGTVIDSWVTPGKLDL